ncbi:MAG: glycosyltransferase [Candidatus Pacebacteria bacterium]|nr:glycosyltransferase [Candidatus Paceibacterota bacterium]
MQSIKNKIINPNKIIQADLVVGIPSYNEADNIANVVKQIDKGLVKNFSKHSAVIINVDNNSADGTREAFLNVKTKTPKIYISTLPGVVGKGNNFCNLFNQVLKLDSTAIAVIDADIKSITGDWVKWLFEPILAGYDYATPLYSRSEYDGSITNHICYPLIYGLLGYDIRQPIGGDFSFSPRLAEHWLKCKWHKTTRQYGIDIFMTMNAILGGFKIAQVGLGAKIHKPSAPKLGPMFSQVVGTLFKDICENKEKWMDVDTKTKIPFFGKKEFDQPQTLSIDYKGMKTTSIFDFQSNESVLKEFLSKDVFVEIKNMYDNDNIAINDTLWHKIVYDAIYAYDKTDINSSLIEALRSLYFGRFISFFRKTLECSSESCEKKITNQAKIFWNDRNYFLDKYK